MKRIKKTVKSFSLNGYQLIALDPSWSKILDKMTFDVAIVKGRLQITSTEKIQK